MDAMTANDVVPTRNPKTPIRKAIAVKALSPALMSVGVRILRSIPIAARLKAIVDNTNPKNVGMIRNSHSGFLKNFSRNVAKSTIEPVSRVVICFM